MACEVMFSVNGCLLNEDILCSWLSVKSESECVADLIQRGALTGAEGAEVYCVSAEVHEHYCLFELLERQFLSPSNSSNVLALNDKQRSLVIERYYRFDDEIIRELLGKKFGSRTKRDLEDIAGRLRIHARSCKRQFDNVRRICKAVEDLNGPVQHNIRWTYGLSEHLSTQYACIVFLCVNRFETSKKRLQLIPLPDFLFCAQKIMQNWVCPSGPSSSNWTNLEVDKDFLQQLRSLKVVLDKENFENLLKVTMDCMLPQLPAHLAQDLNMNFRNYFKSIINLAVELFHKADLRHFFLDLVEKIASPLKLSGWHSSHVLILLQSTHSTLCNYDGLIKIDKTGHTMQAWNRYMTVMQEIIIPIYQSIDSSQ